MPTFKVKNSNGEWENVISFFGSSGEGGGIVVETDPTVPAWAKESTKPTYTASEVGAVPTSRTVNGKTLSSNITLSAADVGAVPTTRTVNGIALSSNITLSAADIGAAPAAHASTASIYGLGDASNYGHLKLSSATNSTSGNTGGIAATPSAVKAAYDLATTANSTANTANNAATAAQTTANTANSTANTAKTTANAALPKAGGTMTGAVTLKGVLLTSGTDYGTSLPSSAPNGKIFFKKV